MRPELCRDKHTPFSRIWQWAAPQPDLVLHYLVKSVDATHRNRPAGWDSEH